MKILKCQLDDWIGALWHLQIGGVAGDGRYRLARFSVETADPQQWMLDNQTEVQVAIDVGQHDPVRETRPDFDELGDKADAEVNWLGTMIPNIDTMIGEEVRDVVKRLAQENLQTIKAWRYILRRLK